MKQLYCTLLLAVLFSSLTISCKKNNDGPQPTNYELSVFKNQTGDPNASALQAQATHDQNGSVMNVYGTFDAAGDPQTVQTLTFNKGGNDTTLHILVNPSNNMPQTIFLDVNGVRQPIVIKTDFMNAGDSSFRLSLYEYDWTANTSILRFETTIDNYHGTFRSLPTYGNFKTTALSWSEALGGVASGIAIIEAGLIGLGITGPIASAVTAAVASLPATWPAIALTVGLTAAFIATIDFASAAPMNTPYPAGTNPNNPAGGTGNPTSNLLPSACASKYITFQADMDPQGSILIYGVSGGTAPYTYALGPQLSTFQTSEVFDGSHPQNQPYLLVVKDAEGCMGARVMMLPQADRELSLTQAPWRLTNVTLLDADNMIVSSGGLDPCVMDNIYTFAANHAFTEDEGATKCDPNDPQTVATGSWSFQDNKSRLVWNGNDVAILELDNTIMKLKSDPEPNGEYYILTYGH